jgi:hypothetical protein
VGRKNRGITNVYAIFLYHRAHLHGACESRAQKDPDRLATLNPENIPEHSGEDFSRMAAGRQPWTDGGAQLRNARL